MSCFVLDTDSIKAFCINYQHLNRFSNETLDESLAKIGENIELLHRENIRSFNYRYNDSNHIDKERVQSYRVIGRDIPDRYTKIDIVQMLKTFTKKLIEEMKTLFILNLQDFESKVWG